MITVIFISLYLRQCIVKKHLSKSEYTLILSFAVISLILVSCAGIGNYRERVRGV